MHDAWLKVGAKIQQLTRTCDNTTATMLEHKHEVGKSCCALAPAHIGRLTHTERADHVRKLVEARAELQCVVHWTVWAYHVLAVAQGFAGVKNETSCGRPCRHGAW